MASWRIMKSAIGATRIVSVRAASTTTPSPISHDPRNPGVDLSTFNPNNYNIPIRTATLDDCMEPYGSWKQAYEAERKLGNKTLVKGIVALTCSLIFLFNSGALEGLDMPNLDNIMEDTEPFNFDTEGRVTVTRD